MYDHRGVISGPTSKGGMSRGWVWPGYVHPLTTDTLWQCPPPGPNFFIFMQFSATYIQNNRLAHPFPELAPPQENPGSATATGIHSCLANFFPARMHSSRMHTVCSLPYSGGSLRSVSGGGGGLCPRGDGSLSRLVSVQGGLYRGGSLSRGGGSLSDRKWHHTETPSPPCEQNDWQTGVKTLPSRNFVCQLKICSWYIGVLPSDLMRTILFLRVWI